MNCELYIQYALTIFTIALIPVMLRIGKDGSHARPTYIVFGSLVVGNLLAYLLLGKHPSYPCLAAIAAISTLLVKRRQPPSNKPSA